MRAYETRIGDRAYAGHYHTQANAVFGAMRFRENELYREASSGLPSFDKRTPLENQIVANRRKSARATLEQRTTITVRQTSLKVAKKVHRVD